MRNIIMEVRRELRLAERLHLLRTGRMVTAVVSFDWWVQGHFERVLTRVATFVNLWGSELEDTWRNFNTPTGHEIMRQVQHLRNHANQLSINEQGFYAPV